MNQARSGPYYAEEFDKKKPFPVVLVIFLLIGATATHCCAIYFGMVLQRAITKEKCEIAAITPRPATCVAPATALTQWACTKAEFSEYRHACAHRLISGAIKPTE